MDVTEEDQEVDESASARYGRPIAPGTYDLEVVESKEGFTTTGEAKPKTTLVLVTVGATADKAPEGQVKIDYHCVAGGFSLRNMVETFEPGKLGKKATLDTASYVGCRVKGTLKWEPARKKPDATPEQIADGTGFFRAKASVVKLIPGSVTRPAKQEDAF